jgi:hypothetical protein
MIDRRYQLAAALSALVAPRVATAQEKRRPRVAFFVPVFKLDFTSWLRLARLTAERRLSQVHEIYRGACQGAG